MGKAVGKYLRERRVKLGVSQKVLANHLGLKSAQSISNIERGVAPIPPQQLPKIARVLKVKTNSLVDVILGEVRTKYISKIRNTGASSARSWARR